MLILPFSAVKNGAAGSLSLQQGLRKTCGTFPGTIWKPSKDSGSTRWSFLVPLAIRTWKEQYDTVIELRHTTEHIRELIRGERLRLKSLGPLRIAYHDSCDLGRHGGVYDAPRKIIQSIPGVTLVELEHNRAGSLCCGGGGNLEMTAPELAGYLAKAKIEEIQQSGADVVVTACQQCVRTIATSARRQRLDLKVMDITELVVRALAD